MSNHIHTGNKVFVNYFNGKEVINTEGIVVKVLNSAGYSRKSHCKKSYLIDIGGKIISRKANHIEVDPSRILVNKESKKAKNYIDSDKVDSYNVRNLFLSSKNKYWEKKRKNDLKNLFDKIKDKNDDHFLQWFSDDIAKEVGFNIDWIYDRIKNNPEKIIDYIVYNLSLILYWANEYEIQVLNKLLYIYLCSNVHDNKTIMYYLDRIERDKFPIDEKNLKKIETIKAFC